MVIAMKSRNMILLILLILSALSDAHGMVNCEKLMVPNPAAQEHSGISITGNVDPEILEVAKKTVLEVFNLANLFEHPETLNINIDRDQIRQIFDFSDNSIQ